MKPAKPTAAQRDKVYRAAMRWRNHDYEMIIENCMPTKTERRLAKAVDEAAAKPRRI